MMSKNMINLFFGLFLIVGLLASPVYADLGLAQTLADQGVQAVGAAVKAAAEAVYAETDDPEQIKSQLVAILNEAAATGDEGAMRYAIVAVMMAGGAENIELSKEAINNSDLFANHPNITAFTVAAVEKLIVSGGATGELGGEKLGGGEAVATKLGGGAKLGGGEGGGGEDPRSLGGGDPDIFDPGADGDIDDDDTHATRV